jgi:hypothetical protein
MLPTRTYLAYMAEAERIVPMSDSPANSSPSDNSYCSPSFGARSRKRSFDDLGDQIDNGRDEGREQRKDERDA